MKIYKYMNREFVDRFQYLFVLSNLLDKKLITNNGLEKIVDIDKSERYPIYFVLAFDSIDSDVKYHNILHTKLLRGGKHYMVLYRWDVTNEFNEIENIRAIKHKDKLFLIDKFINRLSYEEII